LRACRTRRSKAKSRSSTYSPRGLNYKDKAEDARKWLGDLGNPYRAIGYDIEGRVAIDWGVYGVPETFVVDRSGTIRFKHVGPVTPAVLDDMLKLIAQLKRAV